VLSKYKKTKCNENLRFGCRKTGPTAKYCNLSNKDYAEEWLQLDKQLGERPSLAGPAYDAVMVELGKRWQPVDPPVETRDERVDENVEVRIYMPTGSFDFKLPVVVFFHGGGYAFGDIDSEDL